MKLTRSRLAIFAAVLAVVVLVVCLVAHRDLQMASAPRGAAVRPGPAISAAGSRRPGAAAVRPGPSPAVAASNVLARLRRLSTAPHGYVTTAPKKRQVLLSNRRIVIGAERTFPHGFSGSQTPSARGTVPYIVVCADPVSDLTRALAAACGAKVIGFLPANAMLVESTERALSRLAAESAFAAAIEFEPTDKIQPDLAARMLDGGLKNVRVTILTFDAADVPAVAAAVTDAGGAVESSVTSGRGSVRAAGVSPAALAVLASRGDVHWIEEYVQPRVFNDVAVQPELMDVTPVWNNHGLTGKGQLIATADSGLDTGLPRTLVPDFTGRVVRIVNYGGYTSADYNGHGTHTAGSLVGSGAMSTNQFRGVAYEASLFALGCGGTNGTVSIYFESLANLLVYNRASYKYYIHSDSWGAENSKGAYSSLSVDLDQVVWDHPDLLPVFSAGNDGSRGTQTVSAPGSAKNCLTVGASESLRPPNALADYPAQIASFSSRGPCADGRIKPDLVAPGTWIVSVRSTKALSGNHGWGVYLDNTNYLYNGGTSMAAPLTAGACALARQWLVERRGFTNALPTAALLKAVMMGGARDLYGMTNSNVGSAAPNMNQGWGRVDLEQTLYPSNRGVRLVDRIPFSSGSIASYEITTTNAAPLDVQLVWIDYPATAEAAAALVNDLDLVVSNETTGAVSLGNGGAAADTLNNVESVRLTNAVPATYRVFVKGTTVPYSSTAGGAAALYVRGAFKEEAAVPAVTLAVASGSERVGTASPAFGASRIDGGTTMTLFAADAVATNQWGNDIARYACTGWTGSGSVPARGATNQVTVTFTNDSAITWHWTSEVTGYALYRLTWLPQYGFDMGDILMNWYPAGVDARIEVPASLPYGTEIIDWSQDAELSFFGVCRLADIKLIDSNTHSGYYQIDDLGRMATAFTVPMTNSYMVYFDYYNVTDIYESTNSAYAGLPEWWVWRYLYFSTYDTTNGTAAADADGDGFTNYQEYLADTDPVDAVSFLGIVAFDPTNIVWKGGVERTQVVERAGLLSSNSVWSGVHTNFPSTPRTNSLALPFQSGTNSFYRIHVL